MGSNCCKGDAGRPLRANSSIYSRSRAGASLDDRFTTSDDAGGVRLTVSAARTGDSGIYTLQASNAAGSDTTRVRLEVSADEAPTGDDPPTFLRRLQDLTVKVGTRTRFLVEIVSSTECKVTWFRNERRLLEAERVSLARDGNFWCADVAAVSVDDAGRWTCTAENVGGRASCSAHLNVLVPKAYKRPEFVEELRALLTEQGTVSLECKVVGVPTPVLRWFKDSREIKAGDVFALTANAEDPTSLGTYTCEAVNCMGRAYSSSKVHVVGRASREGSSRPSSSGVTPEPPPIFTKELEDQFVRICESLTLGCHIVVPPWPRSVVWYNKEGKVEASERYHVIEDGVGGYLIEVASAEWPDEGEWKCVATSSGGRVGISTCYVSMDVPKNYRKPRFMENLQAVLTEEGLVSFECKVVGFPTPVLSWFKDGQELKPGDVYQLTGTNSLGSYCCIARNCMGHASSSAELTVEDIQNQLNEEEKSQLFSKNQAPKFIQGLKSVEAKIDEPFRFTIKVAIPPEPSVLWYRDDQPVDESQRCHLGREDRGVFNLDIQNLEFLDQSEWKCVAMNDFGHSVTSCFLKLIIPRHYKKPRFLENLQAILSDEGAVNLECKVIGVPQPVLKWYKDGEELKPGDIHRIISGQDGTCCLGTYTCEAQNCMGIAASSASLLGFDDSMKAKKKKAEEQALQRNLSLSTIHEERTSQMYDTPVGDITLDDKGEISFSFDGKEVSVSLYETPDLTEEEALQIVEMYADQLSENVTEHNVVELPPLRFVKETSTSGNLLMEAIIIDVSPEYFASPEEDLRTEADIEDISIADENAPPQLSLDQDIDIGGEDYLEKTMAILSEEKVDIPFKLGRKKSDSQRSADDFYSLSRDQSLSEERRDDDTQAITESDLASFASARSSGKPKSKSSKPSAEEGQESSELTKTILYKEEALKTAAEPEASIMKPRRERKSSRSSRRSSSGSEKSLSKPREEPKSTKEEIEGVPKKPSMTDDEFKEKMVNISSTLSKIINDVQIIERDIILKSELMSSAATASRSLEIISSLITPLSEIHSIADAAKESVSECKEVSSKLFNSLPQPLKSLQQSLTIIEKCIDLESDNKTLVKKTCVAFIEKCDHEMQNLMSEINTVIKNDYLCTDEKILTEIKNLTKEVRTVVKFSGETVRAKHLLNEASEIKIDEPSIEVKHAKDTQKALFELKSPLNSLLSIVESADSGKTADTSKVKISDYILIDMSASIQDLQTALEQIESLSVKETTSSLQKYNTEIIEIVMESILKLRSLFEQLSMESKSEDDKTVLEEALKSLKLNLKEISEHISSIESNVGTFDILQNDNKLEALQKMAQILIALENNLPRLETIPDVKSHMDIFHKNLTKVLENIIESNDAKKYFTLMEICDAVNRINAAIRNVDLDSILSLASLSNALSIIQEQFVKNIFESELNCSILNNIADVQVRIQEAINNAEDLSVHVDSEHVLDISPQFYEDTKANIIIEHIDHTIAAINTVKTVETTEILKTAITPALENICPVLEELKRSLASSQISKIEQEEHISDFSDTSFVQAIATPLCELNQNIIILNQMIVENIDSIKDNTEIIATVAEPLHELHTTLEILQQDIISQYEDIITYEISLNMANIVDNLQSCIVMIQEQAAVEAVEEMSTLDDISGIKTTADTIPSDRFILPAVEETAIEQSLVPIKKIVPPSATVQALQILNEHITVLQNPEVIDTLDTLSEISDYSSLKSITLSLGGLHMEIEEIIHPVLLEDTTNFHILSTSKLTAIAEPLQELQQSLSVLDMNNIPIYENIDLPAEKIHSVFQNISEFKEHLGKCMNAIFPAVHTADNTIEISNKVGSLRKVCENLKEMIEITKSEYFPIDKVVPENVLVLEVTINNLLDATDVCKGIKIDQVKCITKDLYTEIINVQEEFIQFIPHSPQELAQEARLIQTVHEVESNIAILEQYDFVNLSRASDILVCVSPQLAMEIESESLVQMEDIVEHAVNIIQDSTQETPIAELMDIEDFFKTCKSQFTIIRYLLSNQMSHKKIIRLLQEFCSLQSTINDFKIKRLDLNLSQDINDCLSTFLINADKCINHLQASLITIVESQSELLFKTPIVKLDFANELLQEIIARKKDDHLEEIIKRFVDIIEIAKPCVIYAQSRIINELENKLEIGKKDEEKLIIDRMSEFSVFIEQEVKTMLVDDETHNVLIKVLKCIENHQDYKDAVGSGKLLILLKCLSSCSDILQETVHKAKEDEIVLPKYEDSVLKDVLIEMLEPLHILHSQLTNVQEQILSGVEDDSISIDITSTESVVQTMSEKHKEIVQQINTDMASIDNEAISLIMEVDHEIHSIQDSMRSIDNVELVQKVKEIAKPIEDIEKSLHTIIASEKDSKNKDKLPKENSTHFIDHIDQYIELIEIVEEISAIIKVEDLKETVDLARELRESISASETPIETEVSEIMRGEIQDQQARLAQKLQKALSAFQVQVLDSAQEIAPSLSADVLQRIAKVTAQLQADLVAVTGVHVAVQAPSKTSVEPTTIEAINYNTYSSEITTPDNKGVAESSEHTLIEQSIVIDNMRADIITDVAEKIISDQKEKTVECISQPVYETVTEITEKVTDIECSTPSILEQTKDMKIESVMKDMSVSETFSEAVTSEASSNLRIAPTDKTEGKAEEIIITEEIKSANLKKGELFVTEQATEKIEEGLSRTNTDSLVQYINEYLSNDVLELINELSSVTNVDKFKQSVIVAKELLKNIAALETVTDIADGDELKKEKYKEHAELIQQLKTTLPKSNEISLESILEVKPMINKNVVQHFAEITENLHVDLAHMSCSEYIKPTIDQIVTVEQNYAASAVAELIDTDLQPNTVEQTGDIGDNLTATEQAAIIKESQPVFQGFVQSIDHTDREFETEHLAIKDTSLTEGNEVNALETVIDDMMISVATEGTITITDDMVSKKDSESVIVESIAVSQSTSSILQEVIVIDETVEHTDELSAVEKNQESLPKATIEKILQNIDQYLSEDLIQILNELDAVIKVEELKKSVFLAEELRVSIAAEVLAISTETDSSPRNKVLLEQAGIAQQLQSALSAIKIQVFDEAVKMESIFDKDKLQHVVDVTSHLSNELEPVICLTIALKASSIKDQVKSQDSTQGTIEETFTEIKECINESLSHETATKESGIELVTKKDATDIMGDIELQKKFKISEIELLKTGELSTTEDTATTSSLDQTIHLEKQILPTEEVILTECESSSIVIKETPEGATMPTDKFAEYSEVNTPLNELVILEQISDNEVAEVKITDTLCAMEASQLNLLENPIDVKIEKYTHTLKGQIQEIVPTTGFENLLQKLNEFLSNDIIERVTKIASIANIVDVGQFVTVTQELREQIYFKQVHVTPEEQLEQIQLACQVQQNLLSLKNALVNTENLNTEVPQITDVLTHLSTELQQFINASANKSTNIGMEDTDKLVTEIENVGFIENVSALELHSNTDIILVKNPESPPFETETIVFKKTEMVEEIVTHAQKASLNGSESLVTIKSKDESTIEDTDDVKQPSHTGIKDDAFVSKSKSFEEEFYDAESVTSKAISTEKLIIEQSATENNMVAIDETPYLFELCSNKYESAVIDLKQSIEQSTAVENTDTLVLEQVGITGKTVLPTSKALLELNDTLSIAKVLDSTTTENAKPFEKSEESGIPTPVDQSNVNVEILEQLSSASETRLDMLDAIIEKHALQDNAFVSKTPLKVALSGGEPTQGDINLKNNSNIEHVLEENTDLVVAAAQEKAALIQHIDQLISDDVSEFVQELSAITNIEKIKESVAIARELRENIGAVESSVIDDESSNFSMETLVEQAQLAHKLQEALSSFQTSTLDTIQEIEPTIKTEVIQRFKEIVTHLQDELEVAILSTTPEVVKDIAETISIKHLEALLQEVSDKIDLSSTDQTPDDNETLKDTLDEVQTVIIKLKRDYDAAVNDTLNETLEDLECSVRSVQLQINEDSPPELLKEACATLQLLVNNMNAIQNITISETVCKKGETRNIISNCSKETDETVKILEVVSKIDSKGCTNIDSIINNLNYLKNTMKSLRLRFSGDAEAIIENGIDIIHSLNQTEDKVFTLEKDLDAEVNIVIHIRDTIITAVHAVYGSISNMRSTLSSIQKRYLFENYGKPSEYLLCSIKNITAISNIDEELNKNNWKVISKAIRKTLNHFEDIKFYVNLDKTARLPSDSAFTKIILEELKLNISNVMIPIIALLGPEVRKPVLETLQSVEKILLNIQPQSTLIVKEKIPMFKEISSKVLHATDMIKMYVQNKKDKSHMPLLDNENIEQNNVILDKEESCADIFEDTIVKIKLVEAKQETLSRLVENPELKKCEELIPQDEVLTKNNEIEEKIVDQQVVSASQVLEGGKDIKTEHISSEIYEEIATEKIEQCEDKDEAISSQEELNQSKGVIQSVEEQIPDQQKVSTSQVSEDGKDFHISSDIETEHISSEIYEETVTETTEKPVIIADAASSQEELNQSKGVIHSVEEQIPDQQKVSTSQVPEDGKDFHISSDTETEHISSEIYDKITTETIEEPEDKKEAVPFQQELNKSKAVIQLVEELIADQQKVSTPQVSEHGKDFHISSDIKTEHMSSEIYEKNGTETIELPEYKEEAVSSQQELNKSEAVIQLVEEQILDQKKVSTSQVSDDGKDLHILSGIKTENMSSGIYEKIATETIEQPDDKEKAVSSQQVVNKSKAMIQSVEELILDQQKVTAPQVSQDGKDFHISSDIKTEHMPSEVYEEIATETTEKPEFIAEAVSSQEEHTQSEAVIQFVEEQIIDQQKISNSQVSEDGKEINIILDIKTEPMPSEINEEIATETTEKPEIIKEAVSFQKELNQSEIVTQLPTETFVSSITDRKNEENRKSHENETEVEIYPGISNLEKAQEPEVAQKEQTMDDIKGNKYETGEQHSNELNELVENNSLIEIKLEVQLKNVEIEQESRDVDIDKTSVVDLSDNIYKQIEEKEPVDMQLKKEEAVPSHTEKENKIDRIEDDALIVQEKETVLTHDEEKHELVENLGKDKADEEKLNEYNLEDICLIKLDDVQQKDIEVNVLESKEDEIFKKETKSSNIHDQKQENIDRVETENIKTEMEESETNKYAKRKQKKTENKSKENEKAKEISTDDEHTLHEKRLAITDTNPEFKKKDEQEACTAKKEQDEILCPLSEKILLAECLTNEQENADSKSKIAEEIWTATQKETAMIQLEDEKTKYETQQKYFEQNQEEEEATEDQNRKTLQEQTRITKQKETDPIKLKDKEEKLEDKELSKLELKHQQTEEKSNLDQKTEEITLQKETKDAEQYCKGQEKEDRASKKTNKSEKVQSKNKEDKTQKEPDCKVKAEIKENIRVEDECKLQEEHFAKVESELIQKAVEETNLGQNTDEEKLQKETEDTELNFKKQKNESHASTEKVKSEMKKDTKEKQKEEDHKAKEKNEEKIRLEDECKLQEEHFAKDEAETKLNEIAVKAKEKESSRLETKRKLEEERLAKKEAYEKSIMQMAANESLITKQNEIDIIQLSDEKLKLKDECLRKLEPEHQKAVEETNLGQNTEEEKLQKETEDTELNLKKQKNESHAFTKKVKSEIKKDSKKKQNDHDKAKPKEQERFGDDEAKLKGIDEQKACTAKEKENESSFLQTKCILAEDMSANKEACSESKIAEESQITKQKDIDIIHLSNEEQKLEDEILNKFEQENQKEDSNLKQKTGKEQLQKDTEDELCLKKQEKNVSASIDKNEDEKLQSEKKKKHKDEKRVAKGKKEERNQVEEERKIRKESYTENDAEAKSKQIEEKEARITKENERSRLEVEAKLVEECLTKEKADTESKNQIETERVQLDGEKGDLKNECLGKSVEDQQTVNLKVEEDEVTQQKQQSEELIKKRKNENKYDEKIEKECQAEENEEADLKKKEIEARTRIKEAEREHNLEEERLNEKKTDSELRQKGGTEERQQSRAELKLKEETKRKQEEKKENKDADKAVLEKKLAKENLRDGKECFAKEEVESEFKKQIEDVALIEKTQKQEENRVNIEKSETDLKKQKDEEARIKQDEIIHLGEERKQKEDECSKKNNKEEGRATKDAELQIEDKRQQKEVIVKEETDESDKMESKKKKLTKRKQKAEEKEISTKFTETVEIAKDEADKVRLKNEEHVPIVNEEEQKVKRELSSKVKVDGVLKSKNQEDTKIAYDKEENHKTDTQVNKKTKSVEEIDLPDEAKILKDRTKIPNSQDLLKNKTSGANGDINVVKYQDIINKERETHVGAISKSEHYIKEYQYEPTERCKQEGKNKPIFIDHNHRDYTMEFARPSRYREKSFDIEKPMERDYLGKSATFYKAHTVVLDSQLRSSAPPYPDINRVSEVVEKKRSKALSEARSDLPDRRGLSRDLKRKPVFSTYLTDRTAVEGSRVKLTCSVLSSADPTITWYKNGVLLDNKLKYRTKFIDGLITLEVLNAIPSDSAEYSCTVRNENGSVNTSANLKVYPSFEASPIPPTFTRSIRDTYHLAENELVLECRIRGQPLPSITWLKDDKPICSNERYQAYYLADGVCRLSISSPTPEDSGKYTCKAENSVWSDQITHIVNYSGKESRLSPNLTTIEKSRFNRQVMESRRPHFSNVLADYKVTSGGTIGLQVEIRGAPTRVEWLREGHSVTDIYRNARTFVEHELYTLALTDVTEKESGMYTCRAWSSHGNVDMNAAITVVPPNEMEGKPAIIVGRPEKDILISVGEDVNISFRVQGEPKPKVLFMKGIRDITTSQRVCKMTSDDYVKFTLKRSGVSDAGTYCILARNAYGCDRAFVTVVVRQRISSDNLISDWTYPMDDSALSICERKYKSVPDRIPGEPSVVDGGNNWVSLAWPKSDPRDTAPVLAYKVESWLLGKEGGARWIELGITPLNSFDAFNLKQGEEYHFRVTPRNRYGWGESVQNTSPIGVGLAGDRPEFLEILPGQLKVLAGETATLSCSVKGKPVPEIVWMKNGHEIEEERRMKTSFNGFNCSLMINNINIEDEARYSCEATNAHGRASTYARLAVVTDRLIWEADAKLKRERSSDGAGEFPPQFTMRLRDRRVQATYPVRLTCQVVGSPQPTITWFKDGQDVAADSRHTHSQDEHFHTLEIAPTTLEDGGVYEAMARNTSGAVSCRCSLVVDKGIRAYVAPEFCCGLEPLYRLSEGEELRISAVVEAYPSVGVTWYRDGVRLRPSRRAIMTLDRDGQIELALAALTGRDAGVYTCTASNEVGRASTSGKVEVIEGANTREKNKTPPVVISPDVPYSKEPMFIRKPRSSEAREGDTVIIECEVVGDPKPDVYWLRDFLKPDYYRDATHFKRVGAGPEYRFEIPHAKLDYTGAYSVVARNLHGEAKAIISLQILAKDPRCSDDSHNISYGNVEVIPRFVRELTDLLSYDGDAVEFECRLSGNPEPEVRWFHYDEIVRDCPDFESTYDEGTARLKIKQVTADDEGTYSCEAYNSLGKARSNACLVVYPPGEPNTLSQRLRRPPALLSAASTPRSTPRSTPARSVSRTPGPDTRRLCSPARSMAPSFYTYPFNKVVEEGDPVVFQCAVKGLPAPWTTWDKDGVIITPSSRVTIREKDEILRILEIEQVTIEDVGIYRITLENDFGRAEACARLEVITHKGKFYGGVRAYSASPRRSVPYRRRLPSSSRQD